MWKRLKSPGKDPRGNGIGELEDRALTRRYYGWEGKRWPRLIISIYPNFPPFDGETKALLIEVSTKEKINDYWNDRPGGPPVPLYLYDDLLEMLAEAKSKLEKS